MDIEIETWPQEFKEIIHQNKKLFISYHFDKKRIFKIVKDDPVLRTYLPENCYYQEYQSIVVILDNILNQHNIIGYHSTRLTDEEVDDIKNSGMKILSEDLIQKRLLSALNQNYLSQNDYEYLLNNSTIQSSLKNQFGNRTGIIWFFPNRSTLKDYWGLYRLFRSWGGEAVYCGQEEDENIASTLRLIGIACIIKCTMPFSDVRQCYSSFSERFISFFISDEIQDPDPPSNFDMWIERDIVSAEVLKVIKISNPLFEELTNYRSWNEIYK